MKKMKKMKTYKINIKMKVVVYVNGKVSINITLYKKYTITDLKNMFMKNVPDLENVSFFLDDKSELNVFANDKYNDLVLGEIWNTIVNPKCFIVTKPSKNVNVKSVSLNVLISNIENILTGIKDIDKLILSKLSDDDVFEMSNLNKTYFKRICDESFFKNITLDRYPETVPYKDSVKITTWKKHFLNIVNHIHLLKKEFNYTYNIVDKSPELLYLLGNAKKEMETDLLSSKYNTEFDTEYNTEFDNNQIVGVLIEQNFFTLLKYVIDTGITKEAYINAIYQTIIYKQLEMFKYLLEKSLYEIDVYSLMDDVNTFSNLPVIEYLLVNYEFNIDTLFLEATESYVNEKVILCFLKKGANIHVQNDQAFINASRLNNLSVVKLLLKQGVDVQTQDNEALIVASETGVSVVVKYLIENGANVNARDSQILINALRDISMPAVKYLIEEGVNVNAQNGLAITLAIERGQLAILRQLVENGADMKRFGEEALRVATLNSKTTIIKYLLLLSKNNNLLLLS